MNKDQTLGFVRHVLTTIGGVLVASGKISAVDVQPLIGAAMVLAGMGWSWWAKRHPADGKGPDITQVAPLLMLGLFLVGFSGCATTGGTGTDKQTALIAAVTQVATQQIVAPVLANNPQYEPALAALADGIDVAFAKGTLSAEDIAAFVNALGDKYELSQAARLQIAAGVNSLWQLYQANGGGAVAVTTDPQVTQILTAFKQGILDGIALNHALRSTS